MRAPEPFGSAPETNGSGNGAPFTPTGSSDSPAHVQPPTEDLTWVRRLGTAAILSRDVMRAPGMGRVVGMRRVSPGGASATSDRAVSSEHPSVRTYSRGDSNRSGQRQHEGTGRNSAFRGPDPERREVHAGAAHQRIHQRDRLRMDDAVAGDSGCRARRERGRRRRSPRSRRPRARQHLPLMSNPIMAFCATTLEASIPRCRIFAAW